MAAIRKFTFDNDFDLPVKPAAAEVVVEAPPPPPTFSEAEMADAVAAARTAALKEGVAQGRAEAAAQTERQVAAALGAIAGHLGSIDTQAQTVAAGLKHSTVEFSLAIVRQLFPSLVRRSGIGEIEALLVQSLESLKTEPWFTIRVPAEQVDALRERIDEVARSRGYEGRLTVIGDAETKAGDCRIEWTQGGMIRETKQIWTAIEAAIEHALASPGDDEAARKS